MSEQTEMFAIFIGRARAGDRTAMKLVREVCKRSMEIAPDRDLLMIADAIVKLSPDFSAALPVERN